MMNRRRALGLIGSGTLLAMSRPLWASPSAPSDDFFVIIHAAGGWDVTLWADPRNERVGLIEPASTANTDAGFVRRWKPAPLGSGVSTFEILTPPNSSLRLGPAIGDLYDLHDRLTIINGIAVNTVSHYDGTVYSATGRHPVGGIIPESSIDVLLAHERGTAQLMPDVSIKFPSSFVGVRLDRRAIPLRVTAVEGVTRALGRSDAYLDAGDRAAISRTLAEEAHGLASEAADPEPFEQLASQHAAMPHLLGGEFRGALSAQQLQAAYPTLGTGVSAAFAVEAFKRDLVRCVAFGSGGFDTHDTSYREHARTLQELFGLIAAFIKLLDATPHPHLHGVKLGERTHLLVVSEFCRTPAINQLGGRDHYPNNSALIISPRFHAGRSFGEADREQLLARPFGQFSDGVRPLTPPDILATFLGAFGIDPRRHMRDGEMVRPLLA